MTSRTQLFVFVDANADVGYGHLFRCLHLVKAIQQYAKLSIKWIGAIDLALQEKIGRDQVFSTQGACSTYQQLLKLPKSVILYDSYILNSAQLDKLAQSHKLITMDDFGHHQHSFALAVINFCVSANQYQYRSKHQFLGPQYFLHDQRLKTVRAQKLVQHIEQPIHLLVAMGGYDRQNIGLKIANSLNKYIPELTITLLGRYSESTQGKVNHITNTDDISRLYQKADLVISGGGLIKYESAFCGIPNIVVAQTEEQWQESQAFEKYRLCIPYDLAQHWHADKFNHWFEQLAFKEIKNSITNASQHIFDSQSTDNTAKRLVKLIGDVNE